MHTIARLLCRIIGLSSLSLGLVGCHTPPGYTEPGAWWLARAPGVDYEVIQARGRNAGDLAWTKEAARSYAKDMAARVSKVVQEISLEEKSTVWPMPPVVELRCRFVDAEKPR